MVVIGFDLGGTKLSGAVFNRKGSVLLKNIVYLENRKGREVGQLIQTEVIRLLNFAIEEKLQIKAIGIAIPGIYYRETGTVWANNIHGWEAYPLYDEISSAVHDQGIKICIENDRACSVLGEVWMGKARGCTDVIFLHIGTGIGAGILVNGSIVRGYGGAAGAVGWLALDRPFVPEYTPCGCFEYYASGNGIAKMARQSLKEDISYNGVLKTKSVEEITSHDVFSACERGDPLARKVLGRAIECWGMTVANLVSLLNPEKIILGGGVFGPGLQFTDNIYEEARKWAQPVSINQVKLEGSALGSDAALYGAAYTALKS